MVKVITFLPVWKVYSMPRAGMIRRLLQPLMLPLGASISQRTGTPACTVMLG